MDKEELTTLDEMRATAGRIFAESDELRLEFKSLEDMFIPIFELVGVKFISAYPFYVNGDKTLYLGVDKRRKSPETELQARTSMCKHNNKVYSWCFVVTESCNIDSNLPTNELLSFSRDLIILASKQIYSFLCEYKKTVDKCESNCIVAKNEIKQVKEYFM
jgi:hypothetical protein